MKITIEIRGSAACGMLHALVHECSSTQATKIRARGCPRQFKHRAAPVTTTSLSESMPPICRQASLRSAAGHPGHMRPAHMHMHVRGTCCAPAIPASKCGHSHTSFAGTLNRMAGLAVDGRVAVARLLQREDCTTRPVLARTEERIGAASLPVSI